MDGSMDGLVISGIQKTGLMSYCDARILQSTFDNPILFMLLHLQGTEEPERKFFWPPELLWQNDEECADDVDDDDDDDAEVDEGELLSVSKHCYIAVIAAVMYFLVNAQRRL